jgi:uncharacterized protein (DUF779 family)
VNGVAPLEFACTQAASQMLAAVRRRDGLQAVVLAWPAGATYLPADRFVPGRYDVIISHIAGCPVYLDARRAALFRDHRVVLDAAKSSSSRRRPMFAVRQARRA